MTRESLTTAQGTYVDDFLRTGRAAAVFPPWPGDVIESDAAAKHALRSALVAEVRRRETRVVLPAPPQPDELRVLTRRRVEPMVRGLFPRGEQDIVLALLEKSVVFLTSDNIERVLFVQSFDHSAWDIANVYLASIDADLLGPDAPDLVGMSQETTCFVTAHYLAGRGKFDDFVVHEAAHIFHNHKREHAGLPHTRYREWLLPIAFKKREPFAYACEVYARILEQGRSRRAREELLAEYAEEPFAGSEDIDDHLDMLAEAVSARSGWKWILARCAEPGRRR